MGGERLQAALQPVLAYGERSKLPIYVLESARAKAYFVERVVIIITTLLYKATDEEMRGIVGHELAYEYVRDKGNKARTEKDEKLMREIELFCGVGLMDSLPSAEIIRPVRRSCSSAGGRV